jgi:predicted DCC family thiol-disulfide oxidoreductase YuxK
MAPRTRPLLLYDGDCAFCTSSARALERRIRPDAEIVAWQLTDLDELGVSAERAAAAVQWVPIEGAVRSGHEAIAAALETSGGAWKIAGRAILLPGIAWVADRTYRLVAANRQRLPGGTPACRTSSRAPGS